VISTKFETCTGSPEAPKDTHLPWEKEVSAQAVFSLNFESTINSYISINHAPPPLSAQKIPEGTGESPSQVGYLFDKR
jgi:hypothetical protein